MMNPKTRLMDAARNDAPNDSRYDPIARALNTTRTKSCQVMDAAMSTSAASGINTTALRKKVVNPKVSPNPGRTLGCLIAMRHTLSDSAFMLPMHYEHRPAAFGKQRAESVCQGGMTPDGQDEHLPGRLAELARQLVGHIAKPQLGPHFQAVHRLRFGSGIEQCTHAM